MMILKRTASIILIILGCLCIIGYSEGILAREKTYDTEVKGDVTEAKDSKSSKDVSGYAIIGHVRTKNNFITIRTGPDGPLYTVETNDGKILAVNLSAEKLYAEFPEFRSILEQGIAIYDASNRLINKVDLTPIDTYRDIQK
jgi:hypothetical protein